MAGAAPIQVGDPTRYILEEGTVSFLYRPQVSRERCSVHGVKRLRQFQLHGGIWRRVHMSAGCCDVHQSCVLQAGKHKIHSDADVAE